MAQHDYNLANQSGADFRADLNNALSAIATVNSGATEPSTTFAHQLWVDTSSNILKIRNAANNNWITTGVSITASNTFTGNITGNADTATTLATARTINGTSFDGSANISFDTDSVSEGSSNLYFTNERVDDQVNTLLQAGTGIQLTYDDAAGTLTIANTNDADITGVVAGNGLTGGGTAGTVTLNVAVDDSSIEIDSDALQVKALGITNAMLAGSIANAKLSNSSVTINSNSLSLGGTLTLDTDDIGEGSTNLYYTDARANSAFDTRLATKDTDDLSEGTSNLYYTQARFDSAFTAKSTSDLSEGTNLYYTDARARASISEDSTQLSYNSTTGVLSFTQGDTDTVSEGSSNLYYTSARANADFDTRLATKSTSDLSEGTNLYYTTARFDSAFTGKDTDDLSEGSTNVYYTDARSRSAISASGDISYNSSTGVISFTQATAPVTSVNTQTGAVVLDTDDVSEGSTNLYYTDTRANSAIDTRVTKTFVDALGIQASSVDANSVALGTDTTGNYVATVTGTANKVSVSGSGSESAAITLSLPDDVQIADSLTVAGNLTVNGTLTSLDTTNLDIEDNLFQLNAGLTGSPVNDSGMLINRGNQNNGIFMWDESVDKFTLGLTTADGTSTGNITLSSLGTLVANIEGDVTGSVTGTVSSISNHSTSDLSEGTNLYYTDTRFDTRLATKDTGDLAEGSNLYYTDARVQAVSINNVVEDTTPQLGGDLASNGNDILFADSDKAIFGAGSDLQIYHDGSNSFIKESGTGDLRLLGSTKIDLRSNDDATVMIRANAGGSVDLRYAGNNKLTTTSTGIDVTGSVVADGLTVDTSTLVVDSTNNRVGIGTTAPSRQLHVVNSSNALAKVESTGANYAGIDFANTSRLWFAGVRPDISHGFAIKDETASAIRLSIDTSGHVGINNTNPLYELHALGDNGKIVSAPINATSQAFLEAQSHDYNSTPSYAGTAIAHHSSSASGTVSGISKASLGMLRFQNTSNALIYTNGSTPIIFGTTSSERMRISGSGKIGIGQTAPNSPLEIVSNITFANSDTFPQLLIRTASGSTGNQLGFGVDEANDLAFIDAINRGTNVIPLVLQRYGGRLGIANSSPTRNLTVGDTAASSAINIKSSATNGYSILAFGDSDDDNYAQIFLDNSTNKVQIQNGGGGAIGNRGITLDSSENVGIGTSSPQAPLHARNGSSGVSSYTAGTRAIIEGTATTYLTIAAPATSLSGILFADPDDSDNGFIKYDHSQSGVMDFGTAGSTRLRIDSSGNVIIGGTAALGSATFTVDSDSAAISVFDSSAASGGYLQFRNNNTAKGVLGFGSNAGASSTDSMILGSNSGNLEFHANNAEKMRINTSGDVIIGKTTSTNNNEAGIYMIQSGAIVATRSGDTAALFNRTTNDGSVVILRRQNTTVGSISVTSSATSYNTSSDYRLKENVDYNFNALDRVAQLKPARFNFIADADTTLDGFLAHEVQDIVPEAIHGEKDAVDSEGNPEYQGIDQSKLVPLLTKAIQEQQEQIEELKKEIQNLKG